MTVSGCSGQVPENETTGGEEHIPFSEITEKRESGTEAVRETTESDTEEVVETKNIETEETTEYSGNGMPIRYSDNIYITGTEISKVNIYKAKYTAGVEQTTALFESDLGKSSKMPDYDIFDQFFYFGDGAYDRNTGVDYDSDNETVIETVDSADGELPENAEGYASLHFTLDLSKYPFGNVSEHYGTDTVERYILYKCVDDIPICSEYGNPNNVWQWEGILETSLGYAFNAVYRIDGNAKYEINSADYSITETLESDLDVLSVDDIKNGVRLAIEHEADSLLFDEAYIYAERLMYIPLIEYSIEKQDNVNFAVYGDTVVATVYLCPIWNVSFLGKKDGDDSYSNYNTFINAVTGQPLYSTEYSAGDPEFSPGGA